MVLVTIFTECCCNALQRALLVIAVLSVRHSVRLQLGSVGMAAVTGAQNIDLSQANDPLTVKIWIQILP